MDELAGQAAASGTVGPFDPPQNQYLWLELTGAFTGTVELLRSTDGGATKLPLTEKGEQIAKFSGPCCEIAHYETTGKARLFLRITLTSGQVNYRLAP
jgi:hypothetical protein